MQYFEDFDDLVQQLESKDLAAISELMAGWANERKVTNSSGKQHAWHTAGGQSSLLV